MSDSQTLPPAPEGSVPPHSIEAERAVLGALLLDPAAINDVVSLPLGADDFYRDAHARIYRAILALYERSQRADLITLVEELGKRGEVEAVGGQAELARLYDYAVTTANLDHHARIVIDKALLRKLILTAQSIAREASSSDVRPVSPSAPRRDPRSSMRRPPCARSTG